MKNIIKTLLLVMVVVLALTVFVACEKENETPACAHQGGKATCTEAPVCELCGESYGEALGHKGGTSTCASLGICATCGEEYGELKAHTPEYFADEYDCEEEGLSAGSSCSVCGAVIRKRFPLQPTGHKMTEGSCTEDSVCLNEWCDLVITAPGHTMVEVEAKDPTCTEEGYTAHTACECGHTEGKEVVEATGHDMVNATCTEPATCKTCGHTEGEALGHTLSDVEAKDATCTEAGYTAHKACACGYTEGKEDIEALGHVDENLDITCDREGCTKRVLPEGDSKISLFTANNMVIISLTNNYYMEGVVISVEDAKNGKFVIQDEAGDTILIYLPVDENGTTHANWTSKVLVGDVVRVYGKPVNPAGLNTDQKAAVKSALLTFISKHPHDYTAVEADCFNPAQCACGQPSPEGPNAHVNANEDELCDNCGYVMGACVDTVKTWYDDVKNTENWDATNGTALWESEEFSILVSKGTGTFYTSATNHVRLQKNNELTITAKNGGKMVGIIFVVTTSSYTDEMEAVLTAAGIAYTTNGLEISIAVDSLDVFTLTNTSAKTARIASFKVIYLPGKAPALVNAVLDCSTKDNRVSFSTEEQVWSQNGITLTLKRGEGTAYSDKAPLEFGSKGSLTLEGSGIKTIVIETGNTTYGTWVSNCFNGQPGVESVSAKSGTVTIVLTEAVDSFTIESLAKQGKIKTITVNP